MGRVPQRGVGQPQRLADRGQHVGQVGAAPAAQPLAHAGHGPDGIGAVAVQRAVDGALQAHPDRVERDRDQQRDQRGRARSGAAAQQQVGAGDEPGPATEDPGGEQRVEHGPGEDEPDVEQLVAQHGDRHRGRDERDREELEDRPGVEERPRHHHDDHDHQREHQPQELPAPLLVAAAVAQHQPGGRGHQHEEVQDLLDDPQRFRRAVGGLGEHQRGHDCAAASRCRRPDRRRP